MKKWKIWVGILVIFISGMVVGAVGTAMKVKNVAQRLKTADREFIADHFLNKTSRALKFSPDQRASLRPIVLEMTDELLTLRREIYPKADTIVDAMMAEIRPILDEGQFEELEGHIKKSRTHRMKSSSDQ